MNIFELQDVSFSYLGRFPALRSVSLKIRAGEKVAILGANGSGKSTLLRVMNGLLFPQVGEVKVFGQPLTEDGLHGAFNRFFRSKVALLFQNPDTQLFCPTVFDEIAFGPLQLDLPKETIHQRVEDLLKLLRLEAVRDRSPYELSLGEKKKVAVAAVLSTNPDVLLLDEPTASLDPRSTRTLIDLLVEANEVGKTLVTATHDLHIVPEIADRVYIFSEEKTIVAEGRPEELLADVEQLVRWNLIHLHKHAHRDYWHAHLHEHPSSERSHDG